MLHEQVRDARIERGLSQVKLAQLARVPRSQLRKFENGEGITMTTFLKIIGQLPNLKKLTIGPTELQLKTIDFDALRGTLTDLITAAQGVLAVIQSASPQMKPEKPAQVRRQPTITERQRAEELNVIALALMSGKKAPPDHS